MIEIFLLKYLEVTNTDVIEQQVFPLLVGNLRLPLIALKSIFFYGPSRLLTILIMSGFAVAERLIHKIALALRGNKSSRTNGDWFEKCFVRKVGFQYYVDLHAVVQGDIGVRLGHAISHQVEDRILAKVDRIAEVLVHIEPEEELLQPFHSQM